MMVTLLFLHSLPRSLPTSNIARLYRIFILSRGTLRLVSWCKRKFAFPKNPRNEFER